VSATHRVKALKRGGWSVGKVKEQRVYWRGDSKPGHIDPDIRSELIDAKNSGVVVTGGPVRLSGHAGGPFSLSFLAVTGVP